MYGKTSKLTMYDKFRFLSIKQQKTPILPLRQMSQFCDDSIHFHKWVYGCTGWQSTPLINSILTPVKYPYGNGGFSEDRKVKLPIRRYFNQRVLNVDGRFCKDVDYMMAAQFAVESKQLDD